MAHTFQNLSFELPEAIPGDAFAWEQALTSSVIEIANFGFISASAYDTWEEGWSTEDFLFTFGDTDILKALWPSNEEQPHQEENFEFGWGTNQTWSGELSLLETGLFVGPLSAEGYEAGWTNDTWEGTLTAIAVGLFDAGANAFESFIFAQGSVAYTPVLPEVGGYGIDELLTGIDFVDKILPDGRECILPGPTTWEEYGFRANGDFSTRSGASAIPGTSGGLTGYGDISGLTLIFNGVSTFPVWVTPGTTTEKIRVLMMDQAILDGGSTSDLDTPEFFDTGTWPAMDTL